MGKTDCFEFLKKNEGSTFSISELSKILGKNIQSINSAMKKLESDQEIKVQEIITAKNNIPTRIYSYIRTDDLFEQSLKEFNFLKREKRFELANQETLRFLLILKELKKINERLDKNATRK